MTFVERTIDTPAPSTTVRPSVGGKFLFLGEEKLYVRGVTYGALPPDESGNEYWNSEAVERDFAQMAAVGLNAVRIPHTMPPRSLLDAAQRHGLRVMVGLSAEQYAGYLIDKEDAPDIEEAVRAKVRSCAGHPALLAYALGNEIPASFVRWHGRRRIERYLEGLFRAVKSEDPGALVTYVNYPTTEYLQLPFLDLVCFNIYLESQDRFEAYLARLHNIAGNRPLVVTELGLDSRRHGEDTQAHTLDWQIRTTFAAGSAGGFVFAWTDEWYRAGADVDDWDFGITTRDRRPKPALTAVCDAFAEVPFAASIHWPRISVVVCTRNGERTLRSCLDGLLKLDYPDFEVIVVNDGSTDGTAALALEYGFRWLTMEPGGLGNARNAGLAAATGEIVAYIDDDAWPDRQWLTYLAATFLTTGHAGVGGPNVAPPVEGLTAVCIADAPGGPVHVLLSDREAEHIPGCNMAIRRAALEAVGGFDPQFHVAGDDVDLCWRLSQAGWTLGFSPGAMVWHRPRSSIRAYWRQQLGYGAAEALLERKWRHRYNAAGHHTWAGRVYGAGRFARMPDRRARVYHGLWGGAPFQSLYQPAPRLLSTLPTLPEWYLLLVALAILSPLGALWRPLALLVPLLALAAAAPILQAATAAARASSARDMPRREWLKTLALTGFLHLLQPLARLRGRLGYGLTPWRNRGALAAWLPRRWTSAVWTEHGQEADERLQSIESSLRTLGYSVGRGHAFASWDLEAAAGSLGSARLVIALEDHGGGRQLVRFRVWPRYTARGLAGALVFAVLAGVAVLDGATLAGALLGSVAVTTAVRALREAASAADAIERVAKAQSEEKMIARRHRELALWRRLTRQARPCWPHLSGLAVLSLLSAPLALLTPFPLKLVVDSVIGSQPVPGVLEQLLPAAAVRSDTSRLVLAATLLVAIAVARQLQELATSSLRAYTGEKLVLGFRADLFRHAQRLPLAYHDSRGTADSAYRIQYDAASVQYIAVDGAIPLLAAVVTLVAMIYVTARISWQLALVALTVAPMLFLISWAYRRRLRRGWREVKGIESTALGDVQEVLTSLRVVKVFGQEERESERFFLHSREGMGARVRLALVEGSFGLLVGVTTAAGAAAVLVIGVRQVQDGVLTLGSLLLVMAYLAQLYEPVRTIGRKAASLQSHLAGAERAFTLLDEAPDVPERANGRSLARARGAVSFRNVCFSYGDLRPVLEDVSFDIGPGTRLGISGATGAGKTTLVNLLTRFYDPTVGQILLDGLDLREYKLTDLRAQFGIALQEPLLFSASIAENIAYARPNAHSRDVVEAAKAANADTFIRALPHGYQTEVGERGLRLSGGERQRIALARAFLKDAPILILDEPTSSVDSVAEAGILEAMERLSRGRTAFVIAHRPSVLTICDARLHVAAGRLVEVEASG